MANSIPYCHVEDVPTSFENLDEAQALLGKPVPLTKVQIAKEQEQ